MQTKILKVTGRPRYSDAALPDARVQRTSVSGHHRNGHLSIEKVKR